MDRFLNEHILDPTLDNLASGEHERCAWCRKPFNYVDGHGYWTPSYRDCGADGLRAYCKGNEQS